VAILTITPLAARHLPRKKFRAQDGSFLRVFRKIESVVRALRD
jgi:hypothetical protein